MSTSIIGDNANLHAGVLAQGEAQGLRAMIEEEAVPCPCCGGTGYLVLQGHGFWSPEAGDWSTDCDWCGSTGSLTRATATEYWEALR